MESKASQKENNFKNSQKGLILSRVRTAVCVISAFDGVP